jgi:carboxymethylenebutenolidase
MAFRPYLIEEISRDCAAGALTRREALRRLGMLGVSGATASAVLASVADRVGASTTPTLPATDTSPPTSAPPPSAPAEGEEITFPGPDGDLIGVFAAAEEPKGAVLVIHENRGLTPHIRSIPPRLAADGYSALAVDLLSREGGTASLPSEGDATAALGNAPAEQLVADMRAGLDELARRLPDAQLGVVGFCFGGAMTWTLLAAGDPRIAAAVPFYGPLPEDADFAGSPNAAVLAIYAELDDFVNPTMEAAEAALQAAGLEYEVHTFEGVDHAFFNDTGRNYDADAAAEAYAALLEWFDAHLAAATTESTAPPTS